jgi:hypothetical protein
MLYIGGKPGLGIDMYSKLQNNVKTKGVALFVSMNQKLYFKFTSVIFCKSYNLSVLMKKIVFVSEKMKDPGSFLGGQRPLVPLLLLDPPFFPIILFGSTTL